MRTLLISALLITAVDSFGVLTPATGDRLTDYTNWFAGLRAMAPDTLPFQPPATPAPGALDDVNRIWSGWSINWPSESLPPPANTDDYQPLYVEVVFLAESSPRRNDWGYSLNGQDLLLGEAIEAGTEEATRQFGDYTVLHVEPGETLDFWYSTTPPQIVPGTGVSWIPPAKYYVYDQARNVPVWAMYQSIIGTLMPLSATRDLQEWEEDGWQTPFTVVAFEEQLPLEAEERDYTDLVFAYRAWFELPCCGVVPEPSTYGVLGAIVLVGLATSRWSRRRA